MYCTIAIVIYSLSSHIMTDSASHRFPSWQKAWHFALRVDTRLECFWMRLGGLSVTLSSRDSCQTRWKKLNESPFWRGRELFSGQVVVDPPIPLGSFQVPKLQLLLGALKAFKSLNLLHGKSSYTYYMLICRLYYMHRFKYVRIYISMLDIY